MSFDLPKPDDIFQYFEKVGEKRGNLTMQILRRQQQFIDAWNSPIGMQILKDDVERYEQLVQKTIDETITPQELGEFRYLKKRIERLATVISNYEENVKVVKSLK